MEIGAAETTTWNRRAVAWPQWFGLNRSLPRLSRVPLEREVSWLASSTCGLFLYPDRPMMRAISATHKSSRLVADCLS
jgi:hypothetical protein